MIVSYHHDSTNEFVQECSTDQATPEKTATFLYQCVVEQTAKQHLNDNPKIKKEAGLCQLKLIDFIKGGKINKAVVKQKMIEEGENDENAEKVVQKCSVNEGTPEATADNLISCLAEQYNLKQ